VAPCFRHTYQPPRPGSFVGKLVTRQMLLPLLDRCRILVLAPLPGPARLLPFTVSVASDRASTHVFLRPMISFVDVFVILNQSQSFSTECAIIHVSIYSWLPARRRLFSRNLPCPMFPAGMIHALRTLQICEVPSIKLDGIAPNKDSMTFPVILAARFVRRPRHEPWSEVSCVPPGTGWGGAIV
jgi:hypothetical protein